MSEDPKWVRDINEVLSSGNRTVSRRRVARGLAATAGVAAAAAAVAVASPIPQVIGKAVEAAGKHIEVMMRLNPGDDQREARRVLLNVLEDRYGDIKTFSLEVVNPKGTEMRSRPGPENVTNFSNPNQHLGHLEKGEKVSSAIEWIGAGASGPKQQPERWYAFFNPKIDKQPRESQVVFSFSGDFNARELPPSIK